MEKQNKSKWATKAKRGKKERKKAQWASMAGNGSKQAHKHSER